MKNIATTFFVALPIFRHSGVLKVRKTWLCTGLEGQGKQNQSMLFSKYMTIFGESEKQSITMTEKAFLPAAKIPIFTEKMYQFCFEQRPFFSLFLPEKWHKKRGFFTLF